MHESPLPIVFWGLSDPRIAAPCFVEKNLSLDVWACLGAKSPKMPRTPYWVSEGRHSQKPIMPIAPPLRHHLFFIHLIKGLHCFYRITMSLK